MKMVTILILKREDLKPINVEVNIAEITYPMFSHAGNGVLLHEELALFVDTNGSIKVLKDPSGLLDAYKS